MTVAAATALGDAWVQAIAEGDRPALLAVLDPSVRFGALTPGAAWEATTAAEAADIVLGRWFATPRRVDAIERVDHGAVGDRGRLGYLLSTTTPDGPRVIEQQAYFEVVDDRITWLHVLCSGFRCGGARHGS